MYNKPSQRKKKLKEHQDKVYKRQPQLLRRLFPLFKRAEIIEQNTEPILKSPNDPLKDELVEPPIYRKSNKKFRKNLNKISNKQKKSKKRKMHKKKVSEFRPNVLWALR